jgi:hypothetical protein
MAVVYKHLYKDSDTIFYIGIGKNKQRAYSVKRRTAMWDYTVAKYGLRVEIIHDNISWEDACKIEIELISKYGRKDLKKGNLVNLTDGGEGRLGTKATDETKLKMSISHKGLNTWSKGRKMSEEQKDKNKNFGFSNKGKIKSNEHKQKISKSLKGRTPNFLGKNHTDETKLKMSITRLGENNHRFGTIHTDETKQKMSKSAQNRIIVGMGGKNHTEESKQKIKNIIANRPKLICPYCNLTGHYSSMKRWHFENCKHKSK